MEWARFLRLFFCRWLGVLKLYTALLIGIVLATIGEAHARDVNWMVQGSMEGGGDTLIRVRYDDGDTENIKGGGLFHFAGGVVFRSWPRRFPKLETQISLGCKFDSADAKNGDIRWTRYPLELLQFHTTNKWRFGMGLSYHIAPALEGSGFASGLNTELDNATGFVLQVERRVTQQISIGGRALFIDYAFDGDVINGSSFGLVIGFRG